MESQSLTSGPENGEMATKSVGKIFDAASMSQKFNNRIASAGACGHVVLPAIIASRDNEDVLDWEKAKGKAVAEIRRNEGTRSEIGLGRTPTSGMPNVDYLSEHEWKLGEILANTPADDVTPSCLPTWGSFDSSGKAVSAINLDHGRRLSFLLPSDEGDGDAALDAFFSSVGSSAMPGENLGSEPENLPSPSCREEERLIFETAHQEPREELGFESKSLDELDRVGVMFKLKLFSRDAFSLPMPLLQALELVSLTKTDQSLLVIEGVQDGERLCEHNFASFDVSVRETKTGRCALGSLDFAEHPSGKRTVVDFSFFSGDGLAFSVSAAVFREQTLAQVSASIRQP